MERRPPFRRTMPRHPMQCTSCEHSLDASDATCAHCGITQPDSGWAAIVRKPAKPRLVPRPPQPQGAAPGLIYARRYRLEERLLSFPGSDRFVAVQEPLVRRVILTILLRVRPPDLQQALEARFLREAGVLARLRHPNLAS